MCEACGKSFASKEYLRHHSNIHTGSKPYKCEQCSRCFAQRNSLHQHLKIHTGESLHVIFVGVLLVQIWKPASLPACCQASVRTAVKTARSSSRSSMPSRGTSASTQERSPTCVASAAAPSPTSPPSAGTPWWVAPVAVSFTCGNIKKGPQDWRHQAFIIGLSGCV